MELVVGRAGRAHGIRGDIAVEVRTDAPDERFAPGMVLRTEQGRGLTVEAARWHSGRLLVRFAGFADRDAAERLSGALLYAKVSEDESTDDPDEFFDHQLVGLKVAAVDGSDLGKVTDVLHLPGQDVLAVRVADPSSPDGREVLVPFVSDLVPSVDLANGLMVVDPPEGLF